MEGRLLAMLENHENLSLRFLNHATQAWVEQDYHQKKNAALKGQTPIDCYLQQDDVGRTCPGSEALRRAFRKQAKRTQRRSDGSISVEGTRFEIPSVYHHLKDITVRYATWDITSIDMIDPNTSTLLTSLYPQNKSANADGLRRKRTPETQESQQPPSSETPPYLQKQMNEYAATGLPQSYLPKDEIGESHE